MIRSSVSLTWQLDQFHTALLHRLPAGERHLLKDSEVHGNAARQMAGILKPGERAPDFALPNQDGRVVALSERLRQGPVILLFVRGGWCPFCTMTLRGYQDFLPAFHEQGADLLAITPQPSRTCSQIAERDLLAFPTLSDQGNQVADRYGVGYEVEPELRPMQLRLGHDLPRLNGTGNWRIPLPATFVVGADGIIRLSHVTNMIYRRLDPADALAALQALPARQDMDA